MEPCRCSCCCCSSRSAVAAKRPRPSLIVLPQYLQSLRWKSLHQRLPDTEPESSEIAPEPEEEPPPPEEKKPPPRRVRAPKPEPPPEPEPPPDPPEPTSDLEHRQPGSTSHSGKACANRGYSFFTAPKAPDDGAAKAGGKRPCIREPGQAGARRGGLSEGVRVGGQRDHPGRGLERLDP